MDRNPFVALGLFLILGLTADQNVINTVIHSNLPQPISNNAVASVSFSGSDTANATADSTLLLSFMGLQSGKTYKHVVSKAYQVSINQKDWKEIPPVPGSEGRLASIAVGVDQYVYIFGGYTVAEDHSEVSTPTVYRYDPIKQSYERLADMPTPVDDTIAMVYHNCYIYLVSGWHNTGNVDAVQVYDIQENRWNRATPYPGTAVFGHSGGIVENTMIVADGVKKVWLDTGKNDYTFKLSDECYQGTINPKDPLDITWQKLPKHSGKPVYRAASTGSAVDNMVIFAGGSSVSYNYNGIGYKDTPAPPSNNLFTWDLDTHKWRYLGNLDTATMDHRGLLQAGKQFYIVGGMRANQQVSSQMLNFTMPNRESN